MIKLKQRHFVFIALCSLSVFAAQCVANNSSLAAHQNTEVEAYKPSGIPDRITLTISGDPATQIAANWRTSSELTPVAQITIAEGSPIQAANASTLFGQTQPLETGHYTSYHHSITFNALKPNTKYAYRVGNTASDVGRAHWSEWAQFTTAQSSTAATVTPFSFIYFGDAQNDLKSHWSRVIRQAYSDMPKANFMLHAGDLVDLNDNDQQWGQWFYSGGWIYSSTPSVATPGNHEYGFASGLTPMWRAHFTFPDNGPNDNRLELNQTAYYFDYQGTRFISINSQAMTSSADEGIATAQAKWLESILKDNPNHWTVVFHHHPVFSANSARAPHAWLNRAFKPLYEEYGVDLVLQGHDHSYARGNNLNTGMPSYQSKDGPVYVVSVAGPKMYASDAQWADKTAHNTQLYQLIDVSHDQIQYKAFSADGKPYDSFTVEKNLRNKKYCEKPKRHDRKHGHGHRGNDSKHKPHHGKAHRH